MAKAKTKRNPVGAGRTSKATLETFEALFDALRGGNSRRDSCTLAGISEDTLALWIKGELPGDSEMNHSDFSETLAKAEVEAKKVSIDRVLKASEKDWKAAAWWLARKHRDEFAERVEQTGADGAQLGVIMYPQQKDVPGSD